MSLFIQGIQERAMAQKKTIVLPEGDDNRTLEAAEKVLQRGFADLVILGDKAKIEASDFNLSGAQIIDPRTSDESSYYAEELYKLRQHKGMTPEKAAELVQDVTYFSNMVVKMGNADGLVSGACHSTADVLRASLQIIKTAPDSKLVSSFFIMVVPDCEYGENGVFIYADCGLVIQPDAEELAHIAISSAKSWKQLVQTEPYVAMLSHSTRGSAQGSYEYDKVVDATKLAQELAPDIAIDGEMQGDAALVPEVAASKAPGSPVAGRANVLIFPDIDSGSVAYKLTNRLAKAEAYGPITQGIAAPVNDLSRGCSADDIVGVVAITCVQAQ